MSTSPRKLSTVGIVMPCYNLGPYIEVALRSLLQQTFTNYSVYIVDDASTDQDTIKILQKLSATLPNNFTIDYQKKNRGMHKVTNYAAKKIKTDYLFVFSPDDELRETYLEETVAYLDSNPSVAAVCTWLEYFGEDTGIKKYSEEGCSLPNMLLCNGFSGSAVIRKKVWDTVGGYDPHPSQKVNEDYNLWLGLLNDGYTLGIVNKPLLRYRIRSQSLSHDIQPDVEIAWMEHIIEKYSDLFKKYSSTVIPHLWREAILKQEEYKKSMGGHSWLDNEYKKQLDVIADLKKENDAVLQKLQQVESSKAYRLAKKTSALLSPLMRNKS